MMSRYALHKFLMIGIVVLAICGGQRRAAKGVEGPQPNIVLILSDDQSWTDYGFMGHDAIETPNLDRLAAASVTFRRGYVPTALCRPSLATLATGLYSHQNRTTGNDPADTPANQRHAELSGKTSRELLISHVDRHPTLPGLLGEAGYVSFQSGKWWEGSYQRGGFTHGMTRGYPEKGGRHGDDGLEIGRLTMEPIFDFIDDAIADEKPFFVWYAPFMPHTPHNPPERLLKKYLVGDRTEPVAKYYAMCEWFDESCGQLLDRVEDKGIADQTLVVYVTDNGWVQDPERNGYVARSKRSPYEGGTRTPILFRWAEAFAPAERVELCSSIDIVPTILSAAGVTVPENLPGLNLLPSLKTGEKISRRAIFGESFAHDIADIEQPAASLLYRWIIQGRWKLLLRYDGAPGKMKYPPTEVGPQLYDLIADPMEEHNVADEHPKLVARLASKIEQWWQPEGRKVVSATVPSEAFPVDNVRNEPDR